MHDWIKTIPKAVLHDHLDGGLRVETLIELADEQNYPNLPSTNHDELKNGSNQNLINHLRSI